MNSTVVETIGYAVSIVVVVAAIGVLQSERTRLRMQRLPPRRSRTVPAGVVTVLGLAALLYFTLQR